MAQPTEEKLSKLMEAISLQGEKVRELKSANANKAEIEAAVKELLQLKSSLPKSAQTTATEKQPEKQLDERAAKKEARRAARTKQTATEATDEIPIVASPLDPNATFGDLLLCQSRESDKVRRTFRNIKDLTLSNQSQNPDSSFWIRCFLQQTRSQSKLVFLLLRDRLFTIQAVVSDKKMTKFCSKITNESVVDVLGKLVAVPKPTNSTQSDVEIQVQKLFVVSRATPVLAFQVIDANRSETEIQELEKNQKQDDENIFVRVGLDIRLDNRQLDLRTQLQQSILNISSQVSNAFRSFLLQRDFIEINTPKLLAGASEGGAEVFKCDYFGTGIATLAQSPQLHKQIMAACSGLNRVFECAPVFRAEKSQTSRHLTEFQGLDLEMTILDHYHEALDLFSDLFHTVFTHLTENCSKEIEIVKNHFGTEKLIWTAPSSVSDSQICGTKGLSRTLRLEFPFAISLLRSHNVSETEQPSFGDLSTPVEKLLGSIVKEKYGVDFYFLDKFPIAARPFYTMKDPKDDRLSNSYDFFLRGQEIMSGAQRVHDAALLEKAILLKGIDPSSLRFYIDAFKCGAMPHAGGGVGLERVVMLFLGLSNIRLARAFPRDPGRLAP